jgi:hypothetical protein
MRFFVHNTEKFNAAKLQKSIENSNEYFSIIPLPSFPF